MEVSEDMAISYHDVEPVEYLIPIVSNGPSTTTKVSPTCSPMYIYVSHKQCSAIHIILCTCKYMFITNN